MMNIKTIPPEVKREVEEQVEIFNIKELYPMNRAYFVRFRGRFAYFYKDDGNGLRPVCRIKHNGKMTNWEFAIFKWSSERYDSEDTWYPGFVFVDGTVQGALMAGLKAFEFELK
jgi:hypothetical protein